MSAIAPLDPEAELEELREYLGPGYDQERLERHEHLLQDELAATGDEDELYRTSQVYLYDLTVFAMSGTKIPYLEVLAAEVPSGARLLDYGCGIGSDGLRLLEAGYEVAFADFDNPSVEYLRWRLDRRGFEAEIFDLDKGGLPSGFDLAYSFDVIEHVDDPFSFLATIEGLADRVLVNFLAPEPGETELHHQLPIRTLLRHAAGHRLIHYGRYHGRSHLVLYASEPARGFGLARSYATVLRGRHKPT